MYTAAATARSATLVAFHGTLLGTMPSLVMVRPENSRIHMPTARTMPSRASPMRTGCSGPSPNSVARKSICICLTAAFLASRRLWIERTKSYARHRRLLSPGKRAADAVFPLSSPPIHWLHFFRAMTSRSCPADDVKLDPLTVVEVLAVEDSPALFGV